jgi:hypothetical protein
MTAEVESEILLELVDVAEGIPISGIGELLEGSVNTLDVRRVVLGVMQFHDLAGDVRCEGAIVVRKIGQFVGSHCSPLGS